jgi:hypothetical protein
LREVPTGEILAIVDQPKAKSSMLILRAILTSGEHDPPQSRPAMENPRLAATLVFRRGLAGCRVKYTHTIVDRRNHVMRQIENCTHCRQTWDRLCAIAKTGGPHPAVVTVMSGLVITIRRAL